MHQPSFYFLLSLSICTLSLNFSLSLLSASTIILLPFITFYLYPIFELFSCLYYLHQPSFYFLLSLSNCTLSLNFSCLYYMHQPSFYFLLSLSICTLSLNFSLSLLSASTIILLSFITFYMCPIVELFSVFTICINHHSTFFYHFLYVPYL